jgi:hypothetical protein
LLKLLIQKFVLPREKQNRAQSKTHLSPGPSPQPSLRGGATAWHGKGRGKKKLKKVIKKRPSVSKKLDGF